MKRLSIKRLGAVLLITTVAVSAPAIQSAFSAPLPAGAGLEEIGLRAKAGLVSSVNVLIPAWMSALVAFLTRADKTASAWALKGDK